MDDRRPLASRETGLASLALGVLLRTPLTADAVSGIGLVFATLGALALVFAGESPALLILAALAIQARLLCNLMDGLVAVEGGRGSQLGPLWNEVSDRIEDAALLITFGVAAGAVWLGALAAALAIGTAYLRQTGAALGLGHDFVGPFAKPQRMAALTLGCVAGALEAAFGASSLVLPITLWIVVLGTALTCARRLWRMGKALRDGQALREDEALQESRALYESRALHERQMPREEQTPHEEHALQGERPSRERSA